MMRGSEMRTSARSARSRSGAIDSVPGGNLSPDSMCLERLTASSATFSPGGRMMTASTFRAVLDFTSRRDLPSPAVSAAVARRTADS